VLEILRKLKPSPLDLDRNIFTEIVGKIRLQRQIPTVRSASVASRVPPAKKLDSLVGKLSPQEKLKLFTALKEKGF